MSQVSGTRAPVMRKVAPICKRTVQDSNSALVDKT